MTCPRATTSILVPKALWAEEEKSTLKAASENTTLGGQKHEAQRTSRRPEGDVMSCPCRCDCHQEHTGAAAQRHVALSWLACVCFVHLCVAFGDRVLSGCVGTRGWPAGFEEGLLRVGSPFLPIFSLTRSFSLACGTTLFWRENHGSRWDKLWEYAFF